jgi:hypothetical protein
MDEQAETGTLRLGAQELDDFCQALPTCQMKDTFTERVTCILHLAFLV